jgi:hypothetical protein
VPALIDMDKLREEIEFVHKQRRIHQLIHVRRRLLVQVPTSTTGLSRQYFLELFWSSKFLLKLTQRFVLWQNDNCREHLSGHASHTSKVADKHFITLRDA